MFIIKIYILLQLIHLILILLLKTVHNNYQILQILSHIFITKYIVLQTIQVQIVHNQHAQIHYPYLIHYLINQYLYNVQIMDNVQ